MEEDIKILEKFTKIVKGKDYNTKNGWHGYYDYELRDLGKTIENLIKGYRELEEENRIFALAGSNIALKLHIEKNYISKSKIKEKIEEINSELEEKYSAEKISVFSGNTYMEKFKLLGKLQALQELMEDK